MTKYQQASSAAVQVSFPRTSITRVDADGVHVFYRAAGDASAPIVLLLHGFGPVRELSVVEASARR